MVPFGNTPIEVTPIVEAPGTPFAGKTVLLLAAHPDDEMIGAAAQFAFMRQVCLVHLTDGAPSYYTARRHGFSSRAAYALARSQELDAALRTATSVPYERFQLGLPDGRTSFFMGWIALTLARLIDRLRPDIVLTHPYEGGHPDHDAAAWAAQAALPLLRRHMVELWEMTSYHAADGGFTAGRFIPHPGYPPTTLLLPPEGQARRAAALACFHTQAATLRHFATGCECVRHAPPYDFTQPPHAGRLNYEARRRAMRGSHWRRLAELAQRSVGQWCEAGWPSRPPPGRSVLAAFWSVWLAH